MSQYARYVATLGGVMNTHVSYILILVLAIGTLPQLAPTVSASYLDHVVINEVEGNPPGDESVAGGEWVELFNPTANPVDVSDWSLKTKSPIGLITECEVRISPGTVLASAQFYLVDLPLPPGACIDQFISAYISGWVELYDTMLNKVDATGQADLTASDSRTYQRMPDGADQWAFKEATKGIQNDPNTPPIPEFPVAPLALVIALIISSVLVLPSRKRIRAVGCIMVKSPPARIARSDPHSAA